LSTTSWCYAIALRYSAPFHLSSWFDAFSLISTQVFTSTSNIACISFGYHQNSANIIDLIAIAFLHHAFAHLLETYSQTLSMTSRME